MQQFVLLAGPQLHSNRLDLKHIQDAAVVRVTGGRGATVGNQKTFYERISTVTNVPGPLTEGRCGRREMHWPPSQGGRMVRGKHKS